MKRIICFIASALIVLSASLSAGAVKIDSVDYDKAAGTAVISGEKQSSENEEIILHILNADFSEEDLKFKSDREIRDATVWFLVDKADNDKFRFNLDMNKLTSDEGIFTIRIASNGEENASVKLTHYSVETMNKELVRMQSAKTSDEMETIFRDDYEMFVTTDYIKNISDMSVFKADGSFDENIVKTAAMILLSMCENADFAATFEELENQLVMATAVAAISVNSDYSLIKYVISNCPYILKNNTISQNAFDAYSGISDVKKSNVAASIEKLSNTYSSASAFYDDFELALMLEMLSDSYGTDGKESVLKIFDDKLDFTVFNKSGNDKSAVLTSIENAAYRGVIKSFSAIQSELDLYRAKKETSGGAGGGSGGGSGSYGSYVPGKNGVDVNSAVTPEQSVVFTDTDSVEWAKESIQRLADMGIICGIGNGCFAPNDYVTRAQFAKILCGCFGIIPDGMQSGFTDVNDGDWYASYINALEKRGIIKGVGDGSFGVNDYITRQDMAVIIYNAGKTIFKSGGSELSFNDSEQIADYAKQSVAALASESLINGMEDGRFAPTAMATRAETAKLMDSVELFIKNIYN